MKDEYKKRNKKGVYAGTVYKRSLKNVYVCLLKIGCILFSNRVQPFWRKDAPDSKTGRYPVLFTKKILPCR
jgi:hypothetical protein